MLSGPRTSTALVVGGGTMGADVAMVLARAGCKAIVLESSSVRLQSLPDYFSRGMADLGYSHRADRLSTCSSLNEVPWSNVDLVIECIPEQLDIKQALFAELVRRVRPDALLTSNSSSFPISAIAEGLMSASRMFGLHFFMPAHLVPLVEVILGKDSEPDNADQLMAFMRACGMVPVLVKKDLPGFLANRLQHALAREAFAMIEDGVATAEDVDKAVRFGFGFRFLAAGPVLQRDHAGVEVHTAAAATMYPSLSVATVPSKALRDKVASGKLGMKTGEGFFRWTQEAAAAERKRYDDILRAGLKLIAAELPKIDADEA
ncbi:MAG: 3-hydroxyacyl-CoA dehydrogenase NAD-binding domain-containing protein [Betaproteobacteria bacterium]